MTTAPAARARRWPERPHPLPVELGTAAATRSTAGAGTAAEAAAATEAGGARLATGRGDADGRGRHRAGRCRRAERTDAITDRQGRRGRSLCRRYRRGARGRDLQLLGLGCGDLLGLGARGLACLAETPR